MRMSSRFVPGSMPDELYFLCMLHNLGATTPERSLSLEEISRWTVIEAAKAEQNLRKLIEDNYVQSNSISGIQKYFITVNGIRKVLSMYS